MNKNPSIPDIEAQRRAIAKPYEVTSTLRASAIRTTTQLIDGPVAHATDIALSLRVKPKAEIGSAYELCKRKGYSRKSNRRMNADLLPEDGHVLAHLAESAEMKKGTEKQLRDEIRTRARHVANWRRARAALRRYEGSVRAGLMAKWHTCRWPGDPVHLLSILHMYDNGRLDLPSRNEP